MAKSFHVIVYPSGTVHYALARREDLAKLREPGDLSAEYWWHWRSACGRDLIGRATDGAVSCRLCLRSAEKLLRAIERFGDGLD